MSEGINKVMLLGNLGADPELRFTSGGQAVLAVRLATTVSYFDKTSNERKEKTEWHNVTVFGKRGESLSKILGKGSTIFVDGELHTSSYEAKDGTKKYKTEIIASNVVLTGGKRVAGAGNGAHAPTQHDESEDIPF